MERNTSMGWPLTLPLRRSPPDLVYTPIDVTSFFILSDEERVRVIVASANLTQTARRATNQTNYALYLDLANDDPLLGRFEEDYQKHCKGSWANDPLGLPDQDVDTKHPLC